MGDKQQNLPGQNQAPVVQPPVTETALIVSARNSSARWRRSASVRDLRSAGTVTRSSVGVFGLSVKAAAPVWFRPV